MLDRLLESTAPLWLRDLLRRERALETLRRIYEEGQNGKKR